MTRRRIDELLTAANPVARYDAQALAATVSEAATALAVAVSSEPVPPPCRRSSRRRDRRVPRLALGVAAAGLVLVLVALLGTGNPSTSAWAAEQVRFAEASPLLLLTDGWEVSYADERSEQEGEMRFVKQDAWADLHWRPRSTHIDYIKDRAADSVSQTNLPVLDIATHVVGYPGEPAVFSALFEYDGRSLEFVAESESIEEFGELLKSLEAVDADRWLSALPDSVIAASGQAGAVAEMLEGVTLPPGLDPPSVAPQALTHDRYQLGAAVVRAVSCRWFTLWHEAVQAGDEPAARRAIRAMAGARRWPVMREMGEGGDFPAVLNAYARAMPTGDWHGRPLVGELAEGLGCENLRGAE